MGRIGTDLMGRPAATHPAAVPPHLRAVIRAAVLRARDHGRPTPSWPATLPATWDVTDLVSEVADAVWQQAATTAAAASGLDGTGVEGQLRVLDRQLIEVWLARVRVAARCNDIAVGMRLAADRESARRYVAALGPRIGSALIDLLCAAAPLRHTGTATPLATGDQL